MLTWRLLQIQEYLRQHPAEKEGKEEVEDVKAVHEDNSWGAPAYDSAVYICNLIFFIKVCKVTG